MNLLAFYITALMVNVFCLCLPPILGLQTSRKSSKKNKNKKNKKKQDRLDRVVGWDRTSSVYILFRYVSWDTMRRWRIQV